MEPVVIIVKDVKDGKIQLTEQEIKDMVRRAYTEGYWDGKRSGTGGFWYNDPLNIPPYITTTSRTYEPNKYEITCSNEPEQVMGEVSNTLGDK